MILTARRLVLHLSFNFGKMFFKASGVGEVW